MSSDVDGFIHEEAALRFGHADQDESSKYGGNPKRNMWIRAWVVRARGQDLRLNVAVAAVVSTGA